MTNRQAAAARVLLGWSPEQLAQKSNIPVSSVYLMIRLGTAGAEHDHLMQAAFEQAGIHFVDCRTVTRIGSAGEVLSSVDADDLAAEHTPPVEEPNPASWR